jgi:hypothetical protein
MISPLVCARPFTKLSISSPPFLDLTNQFYQALYILACSTVRKELRDNLVVRGTSTARECPVSFLRLQIYFISINSVNSVMRLHVLAAEKISTTIDYLRSFSPLRDAHFAFLRGLFGMPAFFERASCGYTCRGLQKFNHVYTHAVVCRPARIYIAGSFG